MKKFKIFLVFFCVSFMLMANEIPKVPQTIEFAGMKLKLNDAARAEIQRDVDALHASRKYFDIKLDRVNLYFPIIERIFKEENLPEDFKYLVIQESALISDAVSSSNAVGFWQFKDFTGREVGLRIDNMVDERLNIVAASRGAAKYLSKHNFYFNNWVYSLLAYNTGRGGAQRFVNKDLFGVSTMPIDQHTHWYVKKFLAHKVAFEGEIGGQHSEGLRLYEYTEGGGKTLETIAKEFNTDLAIISQYNKWVLQKAIPTDKEYVVIIPSYHNIKEAKSKTIETVSKQKPTPTSRKYPVFGENLDGKVNKVIIKLNGLEAIMAQDGDSFAKLAEKAGLSVDQLAKINEVSTKHKVIPGDFYYIDKKKSKANLYYYTASEGETLWSISQKFGIKVASLAKFNRMQIIDEVIPTQVLWMRKKRPANVPIEYFNETRLAKAPAQMLGTTTVKAEKPSSMADQIVAKSEETNIVIQEIVVDQKQEVVVQLIEKKPEIPTLPTAEKDSFIENELVNPQVHVVQQGETLFSISRKYNLSVPDIKYWNELTSDVLKTGQELKLSGSESVPDLKQVSTEQQVDQKDVTFHEVTYGDTLYGISKKYNISIDKLLLINNKTNYNISVGEKLKVVE